MAIDKGGNLYAAWEQAPINNSGQVTGDTVLKYSFFDRSGNTWAAPIQIDTSGSPVGTLHNNVFVWAVAGDEDVWTSPGTARPASPRILLTDPTPAPPATEPVDSADVERARCHSKLYRANPGE